MTNVPNDSKDEHEAADPSTDRKAERGQQPAGPGASGPGESGYDGAATVGDVGAAAGEESFDDPFGRGVPSGPPPQLRDDDPQQDVAVDERS